MDPSLPPSTPPSRASQLAGLSASLVAFLTALGGVVATLQADQGSRDTQRAAYEALKASSEQQAAQLVELARGQRELREWVSELSARLEKRQTNTEKVLRRVKPSAPAPAPAPPAPPAPDPPEMTTPAPLPPFEALQR